MADHQVPGNKRKGSMIILVVLLSVQEDFKAKLSQAVPRSIDLSCLEGILEVSFEVILMWIQVYLIYLKYTRDVPDIYGRYTRDVPEIYIINTRDIPEIQQIYTRNIPEIYQRYISEIYPRYTRGIP